MIASDLDPATDLELVRELDAPAALLWAAWTDPRHLPHWFVPKPHKVASCVLDLRPGGACTTTFDIGGQLMENKGVYLEIIPGEKLVFTDSYEAGWKPVPDPFMTAIVTFEALGPKRSRYRAVVRHRSAEAAGKHRDMGFFDGWGTVAGQLEGFAQELGTRAMVLTRHIAAPVAKVMRCWTDPVLLPRWFGPEGFTCTTKAIDLRAGGQWLFDMTGHGQVWPNRHRYMVMEPGRISFLMDGGEEPSMEVTVTMAPEGEGTRLTQTVVFPDVAGREAAAGYGAEEKGMETLAKLAALAEAG
jgi:uncharacterized protein YndB with AHSA1/START domain